MAYSIIQLFSFSTYFFLWFHIRAFFYKQHFYKQHEAEIGKKIKQKLSNTLRTNFQVWCL